MKKVTMNTLSCALGYFVAIELWRVVLMYPRSISSMPSLVWWHPGLAAIAACIWGLLNVDDWPVTWCPLCSTTRRHIRTLERQNAEFADAIASKEDGKT
jgi:hypothetical protein